MEEIIFEEEERGTKPPWPAQWETIRKVEVPNVREVCGTFVIMARLTFVGNLKEPDCFEKSEQGIAMHLVRQLCPSWIGPYWVDYKVASGKSWRSLKLPESKLCWGAVCESKSEERVSIVLYNHGALPENREHDVQVALRGLSNVYHVPWNGKGESPPAQPVRVQPPQPSPLEVVNRIMSCLMESGTAPARNWGEVLLQLQAILNNKPIPEFSEPAPPPLPPSASQLIARLIEQEVGPGTTWNQVLEQVEALQSGIAIPSFEPEPEPPVEDPKEVALSAAWCRLLDSSVLPADSWEGVVAQIIAASTPGKRIPKILRADPPTPPIVVPEPEPPTEPPIPQTADHKLLGVIEFFQPVTLLMEDGRWKPMTQGEQSFIGRKHFEVPQMVGRYEVYHIPNPIHQDGPACAGIMSAHTNFYRFQTLEWWEKLVKNPKVARWVPKEENTSSG